jgi:hypothetical protein
MIRHPDTAPLWLAYRICWIVAAHAGLFSLQPYMLRKNWLTCWYLYQTTLGAANK